MRREERMSLWWNLLLVGGKDRQHHLISKFKVDITSKMVRICNAFYVRMAAKGGLIASWGCPNYRGKRLEMMKYVNPARTLRARLPSHLLD